MAKINPLKPKDVSDLVESRIPVEVIESVNEMIREKWNGYSAYFLEKDLVNLIMTKMPEGTTSKDLYTKHYLDFENLYRKEGWEVYYDKPGFNESYDASFMFKLK